MSRAEFDQAMAALNDLDSVEGGNVYESSEEGEFFTHYKILIQHGEVADFQAMVGSDNPIIRVMGAYCLAKTDKEKHRSTLESLLEDSVTVEFLPAGCCSCDTSVGDICLQILEGTDQLDWGTEPDPSQE